MVCPNTYKFDLFVNFILETDISYATVDSITLAPSNGVFRTGATFDISVLFTKIVIVKPLSFPVMSMRGASLPAVYISGNGTLTLVFRYLICVNNVSFSRYTVGNDDNSNPLDYASAQAISWDSLYPVTDTSGYTIDALLSPAGSSGSISSISSIIVDTTPPYATSLKLFAGSSGSFLVGSVIYLSLSFQKTVYLYNGTLFLALNVPSMSNSVQFINGSGTNQLNFRYFISFNIILNEVILSKLEIMLHL